MDKKEQDRIYKKLRKKYTDEEIAESFIFSADMTDEEREQLSKVIKERRDNLSDKEKEKIRLFVEKIRKDDT